MAESIEHKFIDKNSYWRKCVEYKPLVDVDAERVRPVKQLRDARLVNTETVLVKPLQLYQVGVHFKYTNSSECRTNLFYLFTFSFSNR